MRIYLASTLLVYIHMYMFILYIYKCVKKKEGNLCIFIITHRIFHNQDGMFVVVVTTAAAPAAIVLVRLLLSLLYSLFIQNITKSNRCFVVVYFVTKKSSTRGRIIYLHLQTEVLDIYIIFHYTGNNTMIS